MVRLKGNVTMRKLSTALAAVLAVSCAGAAEAQVSVKLGVLNDMSGLYADISGPVNLAAPGTSDNATLMGALRRATHAKVGLPAYRWMVEPGMLVLRQESELILKSRWAVPAVLEQAHFTFTWPELEPAIRDLLA